MLRRFLAALAALTVAFAGPVSAASLSATPATLAAQFAAANPGDTIAAGPGNYVKPALKRRIFEPSLKIVFDPKAVISQGVLLEVTGLEITGGTWTNGCPPTSCSIPALDINNSHQVTLTGFSGAGPGNAAAGIAPAGYGVRIGAKSSFITIADSNLVDFRTAIPVGFSSDLVFRNITCDRMGSDCISMGQVWRVLVDGLTCKASVPLPGAHPDCGQLWSRADTAPTSDVTFLRLKVEGATDGMLASNKGARVYPAGTVLADGRKLLVAETLNDGGFDRIRIEDSEAVVSQANAFSLNACRDCTMKNVRVSTASGSTIGARFYISPDSTMRERCGNSYAAFLKMTAVSDPPCAPPADPKDAEIASLKTQLANAQATSDKLQSDLKAVNDNLTAANQNVSNLTAERSRLNDAIVAALAKIDAAKAALN